MRNAKGLFEAAGLRVDVGIHDDPNMPRVPVASFRCGRTGTAYLDSYQALSLMRKLEAWCNGAEQPAVDELREAINSLSDNHRDWSLAQREDMIRRIQGLAARL